MDRPEGTRQDKADSPPGVWTSHLVLFGGFHCPWKLSLLGLHSLKTMSLRKVDQRPNLQAMGQTGSCQSQPGHRTGRTPTAQVRVEKREEPTLPAHLPTGRDPQYEGHWGWFGLLCRSLLWLPTAGEAGRWR